MSTEGIIAAGHPKTAEAAKILLQQGGNAFDAVLAAHLAACVVEPVFTSLGGGGFLVAHTTDGRARVYDFFVQTPVTKRPSDEVDFHPIQVDFGTARQEFHIGMGAIATPGAVKGIFRIHRDLCRLPMAAIVEPAATLARRGVRVNTLQAYAFSVVEKIYRTSAETLATYGSQTHPHSLVGHGEILRLPQLADTLEMLAREGETWFYRGDIGKAIARDGRDHGGHLTARDLMRYRVVVRRPLALTYRGARLLTNPLPSCGGILIAFALKLLEQVNLRPLGFGTAAYLDLLARAMELTNVARVQFQIDGLTHRLTARELLGSRYMKSFRTAMHAPSTGGTTHVSVIDGHGNLASMTASNGEGSGYIVPGTGVMLNNMLGEEDLNPRGFATWPTDQRLSSMMAPTLLFAPDGREIALGSGGSNRIRTAILQVLINLLDFRMPMRAAVVSPRIHFERGLLSVEGGFEQAEVAALQRMFPEIQLWREKSLFFGGVHSVRWKNRDAETREAERGRFRGAGDPRRGGVAVVVRKR